jgi:hypothetical protein
MNDLSTTSVFDGQKTKKIPDSDLQSEIGVQESEDRRVAASSTQLPKLPIKMRYWVYWFRIGISIFLLLSVLFSLGGCSLNPAAITWNKAANLVSAPVIEQVITENTRFKAKPSAKNILSLNVAGKDGKFILFNFNTPDVCGALGCLYAGYWSRDKQPISQVFLSYLNTNLPPGKELLVVEEDKDRLLPCIKILQTEMQQLRQFRYCFNGNRYQVINSQLFDTINKSLK